MGLGANHFGAFIADFGSLFLGLFLLEKDWRRRLLFLATFLFGLHPLFYAYSRGAYLAALSVIAFFGVVRKRSLLILVAVILIAWQTILPASVVGINMTEMPEGEIEHSAGGDCFSGTTPGLFKEPRIRWVRRIRPEHRRRKACKR
jgi:Zn-dependent protease with chaperone function